MRLLLVEDNQTLAKLVGKKIDSSLEDVEIDLAYNMSDAKELVENNKYDLSILDLNLPDAPDGEIVDYINEHAIPAMVLTASLDGQVRKQMYQKDIIDFVTKTSVNDVLYIVDRIKRILANRRHKVMIVDDSAPTRHMVAKLLANQMFQVIQATDGQDALNKLDHDPDTRVVITDYNMPGINGVDLTLEIRKHYHKDELAIIAISGEDDELISSQFLKMGATDFIKKPFSSEEFYCRINNTIEMLDLVETVTHMQNRDFLTGAYNRTYFFETMRKEFAALRKEPRVNLAVAMIDIDDLKDLDKKYGQNIGDKAVKTVGKILLDETKGSDMVARFGGGEFCVVKKQIGKEEAFDFFDRLRFAIHSQDLGKDEEDNPVSCTVSIGVDTEFEDTIEKMVNEADLLLYKAKEQGKNKTCYQ